MTGQDVRELVIMCLCVILSAYFSATETAFSSLNRARIKTLCEKGKKRAILALSLSENFDRLISTVLIGNNIVNILLATVGTIFFVRRIGENGSIVSTVVITLVVLIFGEITPKCLSKASPERFAMFSAPFIKALTVILTPVNWFFSLWQKAISKIFRKNEDGKMSQEELIMLVDEVQQEGSIDSDEGDLLKNAIEFTERCAEDILTHRTDIDAVSIDADKNEIAAKFCESQFSRLPVYEGSIDNIIGILNQKDFWTPSGMTEKDIRDIMSQPVFVQQSEKTDDLLKLLQRTKCHMAVVVDEYGGTYGIVTMEDVLEELVGEIWDEHDDVVEDFHVLPGGAVRVDCMVNLDDFTEYFDVSIDSQSVSVGGWVLEMMEKIPEEGESFQSCGLNIKVVSMDGRRVSFIEVVKDVLNP